MRSQRTRGAQDVFAGHVAADDRQRAEGGGRQSDRGASGEVGAIRDLAAGQANTNRPALPVSSQPRRTGEGAIPKDELRAPIGVIGAEGMQRTRGCGPVTLCACRFPTTLVGAGQGSGS